MGDRRFENVYRRLEQATDRASALRDMSDEEVVSALAQASDGRDAYLANILATEASNRMRRATIISKHLGEGVVGFDEKGLIRFANEAVRRVLGWRRVDLVGMHLRDSIAPGSVADGLLSVVESREPSPDHECELARPDGTVMPALCTTVPVIREDEVNGGVVVFRDITERKRYEMELRAQRALADLLLRAQSDLGEAVLLVEARRLVHANEALARLTGYATEELRAMPDLLSLTPYEERESLRRLATASIEGTSEPFRVTLLRKDGRRVAVEAVAKAVTQDGRRLVVALLREARAPASPGSPSA
jgi:PAS domain S-box-containing protein